MIPWIRTLIFSMNQNRKSQMRSRSTENCAKQLMALRLTCERLADIATRQLSRTFRLSPYLESSFEAGSPWTKIRQYLYKWRASSQWIGSRQAVWGWKAPKRYYKKLMALRLTCKRLEKIEPPAISHVLPFAVLGILIQTGSSIGGGTTVYMWKWRMEFKTANK